MYFLPFTMNLAGFCHPTLPFLNVTLLLGLHYDSVDEESKLLYEEATLALVNPSDCVDMDCDGRRQLLIQDLDGSLVGSPGDTVISMAEFEWGGDMRFGLGTYI